jgi:valyl-tRNA synthetase
MALAPKPIFKDFEKKLVKWWQDEGIYHFDERDEARPIYSIDTPPPFTSGALHMGHILSYSYFDFAARFKRMQGFNVYYPQGWDCQGFPTEIKVEQEFGKKLERKEFKKKCVEFTEKNITVMRGQMNAVGFSPDWRHEYKTMDPDYTRKIQLSLVKMLEQGLVYHAKHPVHFCTYCNSAIAKAEMEDVDKEGVLNFLDFPFSDGKGSVLIATTRPELLHACVGIAINPQDARASELAGKRVKVPVFGQEVSIVADQDVDASFGTGVVMICTFGDKADVVWMYRHKLKFIEAIDESGRLLSAGKFTGLKCEEARQKILEELISGKFLKKQEKLKQTVKVHDRCKKTIELIASRQWFLKLKGWEEKIIQAAKEMNWVPPFSLQYLVDWANYVEWDWVISRQRIYGTQLPFWYCDKCGKVFAPEERELPVDPSSQPHKKGKCECGGKIMGETAVCDVWIDSSITPLIIGKWPDDEKFLKKVYPSSLRPQGLEIIRTWCFYTVYRCLALTEKPCFKDVLINGSVLGTDGRKMSKSLGNFEDPNLLLQKFPADALRQWAALSGAFAKDRPFSYKDVEFGQSFLVKLWNASKFVEKSIQGFDYQSALKERHSLQFKIVDKWMLSKLNKVVKQVTQYLKGYDYYSAMTLLHDFFWHDFCDYYLEDVKYRIYGSNEASKKSAQLVLRQVLSKTVKMLAPVVSFTTEEIYLEMFAKEDNEKSVHTSKWPEVEDELVDETAERIAVNLHQVLSEVRKHKAAKQIALNEEIPSVKITGKETTLRELADVQEEMREVGKIKVVNFEHAENDGLKVEF